MHVTPDMIDPELGLGGRIADIVNTRSTEVGYLRHVRRTRKLLRLLVGRGIRGVDSTTVQVPRHERGGYGVGVREIDAQTHRILAEELGCVVIAPDCRLSIGAPYPAAMDDCYDTLLWMQRSAVELGIRRDQIVAGGDSAGGGLARES